MDSSPYVITRYDVLATVTEESPRAAELLAEFGLSCVGCFFSEQDTVETGAKVHGMSDEDMQDMIDEINTELEKEWKEKKKI